MKHVQQLKGELKLPEYTFKVTPELAWAALFTVLGAVAATMQASGTLPTDVPTWVFATLVPAIITALVKLFFTVTSGSEIKAK